MTTVPERPEPGHTDGPDGAHEVPDGVDDATVTAVGRLTAALEVVEEARGLLYGCHRLTGRADDDLHDALAALADAGHRELSDAMRADLVGRNVISCRGVAPHPTRGSRSAVRKPPMAGASRSVPAASVASGSDPELSTAVLVRSRP